MQYTPRVTFYFYVRGNNFLIIILKILPLTFYNLVHILEDSVFRGALARPVHGSFNEDKDVSIKDSFILYENNW